MLKLSVTTPSFNQAAYVAKTLESVRDQSVQPFEHLIFDAGSTDGTLDILKQYADGTAFAKLEIGKDKSQSNAINLGFEASQGDIICWLNTDDWYISPEVFATVLKKFEASSDLDILYGRGRFVDEEGALLREAFVHKSGRDLEDKLVHSVGILQPALFMRRSVFEKVGPINEDLHFSFDYEYWVRALKAGARFEFLDKVLVEATLHTNSKTMGQRVTSLRETAKMVRDQFGFAPIQWIERLADAELEGADGILKITKDKTTEHLKRSEELFREMNSVPGAIAAMNAYRQPKEVAPTLKQFQACLSKAAPCIVTAFNSKFFSAGLTLIASLTKYAGSQAETIVYDLGLSHDERALLSNLDRVWLLEFPEDDDRYFDGYFSDRNYGFKSYALSETAKLLPEGATLLWIDAGITPIRAIAPIIDHIEKHNIFVVDHDDKSLWPFHNATFCSDLCAKAMEAANAELAAPHVRAGVVGYKIGGRFQKLVDEAFAYSLNPDALVGDKHLESGATVPRKPGTIYQRALSDVEFRDKLTMKQIRETFGYFGHRHDQTIFSILVARYGAPVVSALDYCVADEASSAVSKHNWTNNDGSDTSHSAEVDDFYINTGAVLMQHRGTYLNTHNLPFDVGDGTSALVLGNGPSLRDFDFDRFSNFDVFGMNAAYRYWDRIKWYPQYYACLDTVLGISHADEIKRLIERADEYGIRMFLLRDNLIRQIDVSRNADRIINFDLIRTGAAGLDAPTISTGSHCTAWAAWLGYKKICLLGIDANYVEVVDGAKHGKGTELEIVDTSAKNPNYFFDDYQQVGDKYNIPNPDRMVHIDSWHEIKERLAPTGVIIVNGNPASKVDAFPFCDFDAFAKGQIREIAAASDDTVEGNSKMASGPLTNGHAPSGPALAFDRAQHATVDETEVIAKLLDDRRGPEHVMLDIGAHFGTSAHYFDQLGWTIHCFEPDPSNRERLVKRFGEKSNISIDPRAVSDQAASDVAFFTSDESTGISGLHSFRDTHKQTGKVDVTTVGLIAKEKDCAKVDFLKIDVEGFDLSVLKGVPWPEMKPDVIEAEFEDSKTIKLGHSYRDICDYLTDFGYAVYLSEWHPIIRYGIPHDWKRVIRYPDAVSSSDSWGNILAFQDDPGLETLTSVFAACMKHREETEADRQAMNDALANQNKPERKSQALSAARSTHNKPRTPIYSRIAMKVESTSPNLLAAGRFTMWALRTLKRYWIFVALFAAIVAGLVYILFTPAFSEFRTVTMIVLGALATLFGSSLLGAYGIHRVKRELDAAKLNTLQQKTMFTSRLDELARQTRSSAQAIARVVPDQHKLQEKLDRISDNNVTANGRIQGLGETQLRVSDLEQQLNQLDRKSASIKDAITALETHKSQAVRKWGLIENDVASLDGRLNQINGLLSDIEKITAGHSAEIETRIAAQAVEIAERLDFEREATRELLNTLQERNESQKRDFLSLKKQSKQELERAEQAQNESLRRLSEQQSAQADRLTRLMETIEGQREQLSRATDESRTRFDTLREQLLKNTQRLERSETTCSDLTASLAAIDVEALNDAIDNQRVQLGQAVEALNDEIEKIAEKLSGQKQLLSDHFNRVESVEEAVGNFEWSTTSRQLEEQQLKLDQIAQKAESFGEKFMSSLNEVSERIMQAETSASSAMFETTEIRKRVNARRKPSYVRFEREITSDAERVFKDIWSRKLSLSIHQNAISYMADRVEVIENELHGRLATTTEDILLRTIVAMSVKREEVNILEIGTLFGTASAIMFDALHPMFKRVHFTLLDPLDGYYASGKADIMTGQPVTRDVLERNLKKIGMKPEEYSLIQHFSLDNEAIEAAMKREYDVAILDGDHSYAGVKGDFENYAPMVRRGGFIIFDDYGSDDWPDIELFVDNEVSQYPWLGHVGNHGRTSVWRVTQSPTLDVDDDVEE